MLKKQELNRETGREAKAKWSTRKTLDLYISKLYHKVTTSPGTWFNLSSVQPILQNGILYYYNRKDISRRFVPRT